MTLTLAPEFDAVARLFLDDGRVHGPLTPAMLAAVKAWAYQESGPTIRRNNPWNLHSPRGLVGQTGSDYVSPADADVAVFDTLAHGVAAAVGNLVRAWAPAEAVVYGYDRVLAAARDGDAPAFLAALARSAWSAGRYGTKGGGANVLLPIWQQLGGGPRMALSPQETAVRAMCGYVANLLDHKETGAGWSDHDAADLATDLATLHRDIEALIVPAPADPAPAAPAADPAPAVQPAVQELIDAAQASAAFLAAHPVQGMDWGPVFEAGGVDLSSTSGDTYRLLQQYVHANLFPGEVVPGSPFGNSLQVGPQIAQLAGEVVGEGAANFAGYPAIPASVLAMGGPGFLDAARRFRESKGPQYIALSWLPADIAAELTQ